MKFTENLEIKHLKTLAQFNSIYGLEVFPTGDKWCIEVTYALKDEQKKSFLFLKSGGKKEFSTLDRVAKLVKEYGFEAFKVNL